MQTNKPSLPHRIGFDADDSDIYPEAPTWPPAGERPLRPLGSDGSTGGKLGTPLLWLSLGATGAALIGLLAALMFNQLGVFAAGGGTGATGPSAPGAALSSPTALPSPTVTTTVNPLSGWLQVTPSSVQLSCGEDQQTQVVVLANTGPEDVEWQAAVAGSGDQAGLAIDPNQGELHAGDSVSVQLQNTTSSSGSHGNPSKQGVIRFTPASTAAGPPASLSFTIERCH